MDELTTRPQEAGPEKPDLSSLAIAELSGRDATRAFLVAVLAMAIATLQQLLMHRYAISHYDYEAPTWFVVLTATITVTIFVGAIAFVSFKWDLLRDAWRFRLSDLFYGLIGLFVLPLGLIGGVSSSSQRLSFGPTGEVQYHPNAFYAVGTGTSRLNALLAFVVLVLILPIVTQAFFRGVLMRSLRPIIGPTYLVVFATVIINVIFVAWFDLWAWPAAFIIELIPTLMFARTQRLWPSISAVAGVEAVLVFFVIGPAVY